MMEPNLRADHKHIPPRPLHFICLISMFWTVLSDQNFATEPSHQTAVLGSTAVLPCRVIERIGVVQWTRDGFGLGTKRGLVGFDRYSMIGSDEEGDFSLRISPVTLEDDAQYQCQVSSKDGNTLRSQIARLTVFVPPNPPTIKPGPVVTATAGVDLTIACLSVGGKPSPEIQWLDSSAGTEMRSGIRFHEETLKDEKRTRVESTLTFTPTRRHHNRSLQCITHNPALNEPLTAQIKLRVEYPPEIDLNYSPRDLSEGEEATVICQAEANPSDVTYQWFRNGNKVKGETGNTLNLGILTRSDHGTPIACEVTNSVGTIRRTQKLNISYPPRFETKPGSESADPGSEVSLKCRVDGNPTPEISWYHQGSNTIVGNGPELRLSASEETAGTYVCVARSRGYKPLEGPAHLRLRGPPVISALRTVSARVGNPISLKCKATAIPHPLVVTWAKNGDTLNHNSSGRVKIKQDQQADGTVTVLSINSLKEDDFGAYNCTIVNQYGVDVHQIVLRKQPIIPLIVVVGGGAGVIVVVLVVITFIVCGRRLKSTKKMDKSAEAAASGDIGRSLSCMGIGNGSVDGLKSGVTEILSNIPPPNEIRISDNDSDIKEVDNRTGSSLSAADRESERWEGSDKGTLTHMQGGLPRFNSATMYKSADQGYMSYVDYSREFSAVPVGETYAQFKLGSPYARSSPANDQPGSLPSSVAPPPYSQSPNGMAGGINGCINGLTSRGLHPSTKLPNGFSSSLRHDLVADLNPPDLTREASHVTVRHEPPQRLKEAVMSESALHTRYILPPQVNKPGTLV